MTTPEAVGRRFLLVAEEWWHEDVARTLAEAGYSVPTRRIPNWVTRVVSWFDKTVRLVVDDVGWEYEVSSERARRTLGWEPRPLRESILDAARDIVNRRS